MTFFSKIDTKRLRNITDNTIKCSCGHSMLMNKDKVLCTWCGKYVYKDKKLEFEDKLKASLKRRINENI
jgi:uncharacterized paraquat-inducible protein A